MKTDENKSIKSSLKPISLSSSKKTGLAGKAVSKVLMAGIKFYRLVISPHLGLNCRYSPSCSQYAYEAIQKYGPLKGVSMAAKRISRCHPGHPGGYDPVP